MIYQKNTDNVIKEILRFAILLSISLLIHSCDYRKMPTFEPELSSTISEKYDSTRKWILNDSITGAYAFNGEANIIRKIFTVDSVLLAKEDIPDVVIFKDNSRNKLRIYPYPDGQVEYSFTKSDYYLKITYWDNYKGIKGNNVFVKPSESTLIFKDESFNMGDTVLGYLELSTKPYYRNKTMQFDRYEGYFTCIIFPKDSIIKYPIHYYALFDQGIIKNNVYFTFNDILK